MEGLKNKFKKDDIVLINVEAVLKDTSVKVFEPQQIRLQVIDDIIEYDCDHDLILSLKVLDNFRMSVRTINEGSDYKIGEIVRFEANHLKPFFDINEFSGNIETLVKNLKDV